MTYKRNLIEENKRAENQSFLYFLHEEKKFDVKALDDLCQCISELETISLEQLRDIHFIEKERRCKYDNYSGTIIYKLVKEKIWSTNQITIFMNTILMLCII